MNNCYYIIGCHLDVEWANELILFSMNFRSHFCMCHRQIFVAKMKNYENYHSIQAYDWKYKQVYHSIKGEGDNIFIFAYATNHAKAWR